MKLKMVGERGFEPPAPASRRQCSTRLSYSPIKACGGVIAVSVCFRNLEDVKRGRLEMTVNGELDNIL